jgi:hypothetical protein
LLSPIKEIVRFNQEAGLLEAEYDDERECAYPIEEALEGFDLTVLSDKLDLNTNSPKEISRSIINLAVSQVGIYPQTQLKDVDRLDKHCDEVVFAVGSMAKLGLSSQQITHALNIVMSANFRKLGAPKDSMGKQTKPVGWVGPEPELQKILDSRST